MPQDYQYEINGQLFYVNPYSQGWAWWSAYSEMEGYAASPLEALQNAINHVKKQIDDKREAEEQAESDRLYGTEHEQLQKYYNDTRL